MVLFQPDYRSIYLQKCREAIGQSIELNFIKTPGSNCTSKIQVHSLPTPSTPKFDVWEHERRQRSKDSFVVKQAQTLCGRRLRRKVCIQKKEAHFACVTRITFGDVSLRKKRSNIFVSGEQQRKALAESGVTVVANITKDRLLVAWAQDTGRGVYIGRNYRGWREAGWGNPFSPQAHVPEEHDRVIRLYAHHLDDNPILLARLPELCGGKVLLCWCHPLPCHGDVLASRANALTLGVKRRQLRAN